MSNDKVALDQLSKVSDLGQKHTIFHYLYFPKKDAAKKVAQQLRTEGFEIEDRLGADGINWLVLARHDIVPSDEAMATAREKMEQLAESLGGEYDGWEAAVGQ
jgi:hypothetical protein